MKKKYDYIDSLRGIAVLMVVLVHVGQTVHGLNPVVNFMTRYGQLGVQLFFLISAFTLCLSMDRRSSEKFSVAKFYIRRYFRVAPLYYLGIAGYFVIRMLQESLPGHAIVFPERFNFTNVAFNITMSHGFVPAANNNIVPGGWSIGTEMIFYLLFPLLFSMTRKMVDKRVSSLIYLVLGGLLFSLIVQGPVTFYDMDAELGSFMYFNITNQLPVFLTGIASYELYKRGFFDSIASWVVVLSLFACVGITIELWLYSVMFSQTLVPFCAGISFVFLMIIFSRSNKLNGTIIRHLGELSFSIYLVHFVFARVLGSVFNNLQQYDVSPELILLMHFFLTTSVSYVLAIWTQRNIEKRGIAAGRFLIRLLYGHTAKDSKITLA